MARGVAVTVSALALVGLAAAVALAASTDFAERPSSPVLVASRPTFPVIADLDGDGDRDAAVASNGADAVTILVNNGAGDLHERATNSPVGTGADPVAMVATDLDGDGDADLATADQLSFGLSILINTAPAASMSDRPARRRPALVPSPSPPGTSTATPTRTWSSPTPSTRS